MSPKEQVVLVDGRKLKLSNLDKVLWPRDKITKAELIKYYAEIGRYMTPFIKDRPLMVQRYPNGIHSEYFVQKHFPAAPSWIETFSFKKEDYVLCNNLPTLIWLGNLAAVEINHMLALAPAVKKHDIVLIDLDPHPPARFEEGKIAARGVATLLERLELEFLVKTSGADGIHFFIPIKPKYSVSKIRRFVHAIGKLIEKADPKLATVSPRRERKRGRVYIDFLQNGLEKTITAPLSARALPEAPVSYPLTMKQLEHPKIGPTAFTIRKAPRESAALRHMFRVGELSQDLEVPFARLGLRG